MKSDEIDDRFFETPYYLVPAKGGERAYALLREAIRESGRVGIAKFILRDAQHLAAVEVIGDALVLTVMRFADELVDAEAVRLPGGRRHPQARARHGEGARQQPRGEWDPAKYTDQYRENLLRIIQGKVKGKDVELEPTTEPPRAEVVDLMERLRRSLEQSGHATALGQAPATGEAAAAKAAPGPARAQSRARKKPPARKRSRRAA